MRTIPKTAAVFILSLVVPNIAGAADEKPIIPVKVQLVLTRYQGDKKVGSLPYTLVVNANGPRAQLRMGSQVPVPSTTFTPKEAGSAPLTSYAPSFRNFRITEQVLLKDGQSREFVAATDKVNGEVTKVEVTLTVVK